MKYKKIFLSVTMVSLTSLGFSDHQHEDHHEDHHEEHHEDHHEDHHDHDNHDHDHDNHDRDNHDHDHGHFVDHDHDGHGHWENNHQNNNHWVDHDRDGHGRWEPNRVDNNNFDNRPDIAFRDSPASDRSFSNTGGGGSDSGGCAPKTEQKNLAKTETALKGLDQKQLAHRSDFRQAIRVAAAQKTPRKRGEAYMRLAGVKNPSDMHEVKAFFNPNAKPDRYLEAIQHNLKLNKGEAQLVYDTVKQELLDGQSI